jgi:hypothetical protein
MGVFTDDGTATIDAIYDDDNGNLKRYGLLGDWKLVYTSAIRLFY